MASTIIGAQGEAEEGEHHPEHDREPAPVDAALGRVPAVAGAELAGDAGGRAVREEVEDGEGGGEDGAGDGEPGERPGAEMADDGGVGQQVQGLGGQRARGRARPAARSPGRTRVLEPSPVMVTRRRAAPGEFECRTPVRCWWP